MSKTYKISRAHLRLIYKMRHHKGHGIHSPFVFSLINDVIEEKKPYYAYSDIAAFLSDKSCQSDKDEKCNKLLFRLVNRFSCIKILDIGSTKGISTLYLTAPSKQIDCTSIGCGDEGMRLHNLWGRNIKYEELNFDINIETQDFIYVDLAKLSVELDSLAKFLLSNVYSQSIIVIKGIRNNKKSRAFWVMLESNNSVFVSLDLYHIGILFFDSKYIKQKYKLSF